MLLTQIVRFADPNGLNSTEDPLVFKSFSGVYNALSLRSLLWHAVPGNHDYGDVCYETRDF